MNDRPEPRICSDLPVRIFGMGSDGHAFSQPAQARNISQGGALVAGLEHPVAVGDIVGVQLKDRKARFRVVWVIDGRPSQQIQAGVEMLDGQQIPWAKELEAAAPTTQSSSPKQNLRRFQRFKTRLPIELHEHRSGGAPMQTNATDISGRGCYVETFLPLPRGTVLEVTFWADAEKIHTSAVVRASDPGVGMGIEFVGLDEETQIRLQGILQRLNPTVSGLAAPRQP